VLGKAYRVKTKPELENLQVASKFLGELFNALEEKVLDIIDESSQVKQSALSAKIDGILENDKKLKEIAKKLNADPLLLSQPTLVTIQSGVGIDIHKVSLESSD